MWQCGGARRIAYSTNSAAYSSCPWVNDCYFLVFSFPWEKKTGIIIPLVKSKWNVDVRVFASWKEMYMIWTINIYLKASLKASPDLTWNTEVSIGMNEWVNRGLIIGKQERLKKKLDKLNFDRTRINVSVRDIWRKQSHRKLRNMKKYGLAA